MSEQGTVKDLTVVDPTGTSEAPVSREEEIDMPPNIKRLAGFIAREGCPSELLQNYLSLAKMSLNQKE